MPSTYLHGPRLGWPQAPAAVRDWVAERAGTVSGFEDRVGGMSTGLATVVTGDRRSVFVKGLDATLNSAGERFYRREAEFAARLPDLPSIPRLLDQATIAVDDHQWVVLLYPAATGLPPQHPWRAADLTRVLDAWLPVRDALANIPDWPRNDLIAPLFTGWRTIAASPDDPWHELAADWIDREERFVAAATETGPLIGAHVDLRADNLLLGPDGVWFVDWAHPDLAAPWLDPLIMLCDVVASGGDHGDGGEIDVARVWAEHPACAGADPEILIDGLSAFAAFMHAGSLKPPHPAVPHGRAWQRLVSERTLPYVLRHR
ncbi:BUD32 family EKC/KEOPS complex subunit [Microlunatus parietis]|uniref:Phosphotransferase enzyme family protein n=1 Tax=Microlunatus parietis TaxID=682979 RepID=A0A7Y9I707_9ACTN|nr:hypothetical protein [Microlunatus parietis]NYE71456.1 hypothetical protein [Microlunatus parietis]